MVPDSGCSDNQLPPAAAPTISRAPSQWGPGFLTSPSRGVGTPLPTDPPGSPGPSRRCPSPATLGRACPDCRCSETPSRLPACADPGEGSARAAGAARLWLGLGRSEGTRRPPCLSFEVASGGRFLLRSVRPRFPLDFGSARLLTSAGVRRRACLQEWLSGSAG